MIRTEEIKLPVTNGRSVGSSPRVADVRLAADERCAESVQNYDRLQSRRFGRRLPHLRNMTEPINSRMPLKV